jgi:hypothetical protein
MSTGDGVLNDDKYEYDSIGYPFNVTSWVKLFTIMNCKGTRKYKPDLSKFKIQYEHAAYK